MATTTTLTIAPVVFDPSTRTVLAIVNEETRNANLPTFKIESSGKCEMDDVENGDASESLRILRRAVEFVCNEILKVKSLSVPMTSAFASENVQRLGADVVVVHLAIEFWIEHFSGPYSNVSLTSDDVDRLVIPGTGYRRTFEIAKNLYSINETHVKPRPAVVSMLPHESSLKWDYRPHMGWFISPKTYKHPVEREIN